MATDSSIYNLIQPQRMSDPLEQAGKAFTLQNLVGQSELQGLQTQQMRQGITDDQALREAYSASGGDPEKLKALLYKSGNPKAIQSFEKTQADKLKADSELQKTDRENYIALAKQSAEQLPNLTTPEAYAAYRDGVLSAAGMFKTPEMRAIALRQAQSIPQQFDPEWIKRKLVDAKDLFTPKPQEVKAPDGSIGFEDMNPFTNPGILTKKYAPGMTPSEAATDQRGRESNRIAAGNLGVAQANLGVSRDRLAFEQNAPQYMETDAGLVALPKKPAVGVAPVGTPVMGADGQPLGKPLKPLPPNVNDAIISNAQSLYTLDKAIKLLGGKNVDSAKGDKEATGWKGYLPQAILNRLDASGVDTRAEIADIGSLKIHDRSGAAVTISESPRLMPFIPSAVDEPAVAARKLTRLFEEAKRMQQGLTDTYSKDQGYKPSPVLSAGGLKGQPAPTNKTVPDAAPTQADIDAELRRRRVIK